MLYFFLGGIIFRSCSFCMAKLKENQKLNAGNIILLILSSLFIILASAWAAQSIMEGEMQAAAMGILIFGGIGIILAIVLYRLGLSKKAMLR